MTREEYQEHKKDYENYQLSGGCFVLFQYQYISTLEAQLKKRDEEIERLEAELIEARKFISTLDYIGSNSK